MTYTARRYVLVKAVCQSELMEQQFREALEQSVRTCFGELGSSRMDPKIIRFDVASSTGIVSCEQNAVKELETALALVTEYSRTDLTLLALRVSGTIRGIRKGARQPF